MEYHKKCISSRFLKLTYPTFKQLILNFKYNGNVVANTVAVINYRENNNIVNRVIEYLAAKEPDLFLRVDGVQNRSKRRMITGLTFIKCPET